MFDSSQDLKNLLRAVRDMSLPKLVGPDVPLFNALCGDLFPRLSAEDRNRVYFYTLFPTLFLSPHPDYVLTHRIERQDVDSTRIVCDWLLPQTVIDRPPQSVLRNRRNGDRPSHRIEFMQVAKKMRCGLDQITSFRQVQVS